MVYAKTKDLLRESLMEWPRRSGPVVFPRGGDCAILVVYWVYRQTEHQMVGSLVRDTWVRTALGLRRIRHEKVFPDRVLVDDGKPVILGPHSN
jgi:hypothetical protein